MVSMAASRRFISLLTSSAMKLVMTMRGSCSTTWPSAMPSLSAAPGVVHGLCVQALGGIELEAAVDAQHIDRADLRHHVGGDQHHDLVEAFLRADRLRHHFAKPAQQHARTAERATHGVILGWWPEQEAPTLLSQEIAPTGPVARGRISPMGYSECPMQTASQTAG